MTPRTTRLSPWLLALVLGTLPTTDVGLHLLAEAGTSPDPARATSGPHIDDAGPDCPACDFLAQPRLLGEAAPIAPSPSGEAEASRGERPVAGVHARSASGPRGPPPLGARHLGPA